MKPARPPRFCAWAIAVRVSVVFPGALRTENLNDSPARKTPNPKRAIDQDIPSRNDFNRRYRCVAEPANCFAAVVLFDLLDGQIEVFRANGGGLFVKGGGEHLQSSA